MVTVLDGDFVGDTEHGPSSDDCGLSSSVALIVDGRWVIEETLPGITGGIVGTTQRHEGPCHQVQSWLSHDANF